MAIYKIIIEPVSVFGTPLKGDTIFGHFCWQAAQYFDLLNGGLDHWIEQYPERPCAVFSSAWPIITENGKATYALKRPDVPASMLETANASSSRRKRIENRKKNKKKKWLLVGKDLRPLLLEDRLISDDELFERYLAERPLEEQQQFRLLSKKQKKIMSIAEQQHNTINRLTMTTGKGIFAPYVMENFHFPPGMELAIFAFIDEEATDMNRLRQAFERIGQWGFGRDASTGLGRFQVIDCHEVDWPKMQPDQACYTLSPCVPQKDAFREYYFTPFTRFGRHGAELVLTGKPFKNPISMADEGAVFYPADQSIFKKPYIGRALTNLSKAEPKTVAQGYSIYLPLSIYKQEELCRLIT